MALNLFSYEANIHAELMVHVGELTSYSARLLHPASVCWLKHIFAW